jgi:thiamine-monophosphate kinase
MDEFEIIRHYFATAHADSSVRIGIGDDGAVMRPDNGRDLVTVVDTIVEGVHFPVSLAAADIGYRAVAVNLSDIAAMAARPRWMTLALTLREVDRNWLKAFSGGLFAAAGEHGVTLVGGDTTRGEQTVISIQVTGDVDPNRVLARSGASRGDSIFVSGSPGDAAAGLGLIQSDSLSSESARKLAYKFCHPIARIELAQKIAPLASAAIDISDGLYADLQKLLLASSVGGQIELQALPLSAEITNQFGLEEARVFALSGGDDYELCFTIPARNEASLAELVLNDKLRITRIGSVLENDGLACTQNGTVVDYSDAGFLHFGGSGDE